MREGDRNSKYFHGLLARRGPHSGIHSLIIDGSLVSDSSTIDNHIIGYFSDLFAAGASSKNFSSVASFIPRLVTNEQNLELCRMPSTEEIKNIFF